MPASRPIRWPRHLLRFRLRTLLIATLALSLACGYLGRHLYRQSIERPIVDRIIAAGGQVRYDYQRDERVFGGYSWAQPPGPYLLRRLFGDDLFARVEAVYLLSGQNTDAHVRILTKFDGLRYVSLYGPGITDAGVEELLSRQTLEAATFRDTSITPDMLARLAKLRAFYELALTDRSATAAHIEGGSEIRTLTNLTLIDSQADGGALAPLAKLDRLESLKIYRCPNIDDDGIASLSGLSQLRWLDIRETSVTNQAMQTIATFSHLEQLLLPNSPITDQGAAELSNLTRLESLDLSFTQITDEGLLQLANLPALRFIEFSLGSITLQGARAFQAAAPQCEITCWQIYPDGTTAEIDIETGEVKVE